MNIQKLIIISVLITNQLTLLAQQPIPTKPRILISTDIGGTDPDDNQSMAHFLMYANLFNTEGLVSSPSYGHGTKKELLRMIDLYEQDLPKLQQQAEGFPSAQTLKAICKQGRHGAAPYKGYTSATEGSDWIVKCAKKKSKQPLWVLVWGGLDDLAQALHDAPEIQKNIKVYWIGGPNKKWSANSYAYIARNFPNLWFIEVNSSYYGFFSDGGDNEALVNENFYKNHINNAGELGKDFQKYYKGNIKMGDTPSLLYMMDGNPNNPARECWGGSFEKTNRSTRIVFDRTTTMADTVSVYAVVELHLKGPKINIPPDSACFTMAVKAKIGEQKWAGFYAGDGNYVIRYCPKQTEALTYKISSPIEGFVQQDGSMFVSNIWPNKPLNTDYKLGKNWYTDRANPTLFDGQWQGAKTTLKWRNDALLDWAKRWKWLK
jgi:Protein of unknown function (DUF1593)/Domain of unknown function (DUF5060)